MLSEKNYLKGKVVEDTTKYNINYDKQPLLDIVCANLASKLLTQKYVSLTDEERKKLESLTNK